MLIYLYTIYTNVFDKLIWCTIGSKSLCSSYSMLVFSISSYGAPLAQRASYLTLLGSLLRPVASEVKMNLNNFQFYFICSNIIIMTESQEKTAHVCITIEVMNDTQKACSTLIIIEESQFTLFYVFMVAHRAIFLIVFPQV